MSVLDFVKRIGKDITQPLGVQPPVTHPALPIAKSNQNQALQPAPNQPMSVHPLQQALLGDAIQGNTPSAPASLQGSWFSQTAPQIGPTMYNLHRLANQVGTNHGAMPPNMVNVAWSNQQVPYAQSLNPPSWYVAQMQNNGNQSRRMTVR